MLKASVSLFFGGKTKDKDDFYVEVEGLSKGELRVVVMDAIREALKKTKKCKDFSVCN